MIWLLNCADVAMTIQANDAASVALIEAAFSELGLKPCPQTQALNISVNAAGDASWLIEDLSGNFKRQVASEGDLIYHLSDRIIFNVADKATTGHCLHAAAVAAKSAACVIPAQSGAGKSSLTCWLVANGFAYLTDELIVVDAKQAITAVARPIQIKSHGLDVIKPLLKEGASIFHGGFANAITASSLGGEIAAPRSRRIALFLFPKYVMGSGYQLNRLSSAEAGMCLMSNHVNARNLQNHGFRAMMKLIRETPSFELEYGGFDQLPSNFAEKLISLMLPSTI